MGFTSSIFLFIFIPLTICAFFVARKIEGLAGKGKSHYLSDAVLVLASILFYCFSTVFPVFNIVTLVLAYVLGIFLLGRIIHNSSESTKKMALFLGIVVLVGVLFFCKYCRYYLSIFNDVEYLKFFDNLWVPLGISFIVFSTISYLVDVYKGEAPGNYLDVALFILFFPKVASGPIVKWREWVNGVRQDASLEDVCIGVERICIGFGKKLIFADYFGGIVADIHGQMALGIDTPTAWIAAILYTMEIYLDFSAYSDIAIGLSRVFGFKFDENFNYPYTSTSVTEFWRRWHISLGSWFREYLYIPLGGNRRGKSSTLINLAIVFIVTGIWHGAGLRYLFWGAMHGVCILFEKAYAEKDLYKKLPSVLRWLLVMLIVIFGWVCFWQNSTGALFEYYGLMFGVGAAVMPLFSYSYYLFKTKTIVLFTIALIMSLVGKTEIHERIRALTMTNQKWIAVKRFILIVLMGVAIMCMINSVYSPFIYFQF